MTKLVKTLSAISVSAVMMVGLVPNAYAEGMNVPTIEASEVMSGLENPWDMSFVSDGSMFYTEKCKGLSVRTASGDVNALYGMKGSSGYSDSADDLFCDGQAGMLGVVADSDFDSNRTLYLYSTSDKYYGEGCKTNFEKCDGNIVMSFKVSDDLKSVSDRKDIVTDIQYKPFESDQPFGGPGAHNGGRLRIGPDGYLWVTGGDRHRGICPQDGSLLCGKVLRVDGDLSLIHI